MSHQPTPLQYYEADPTNHHGVHGQQAGLNRRGRRNYGPYRPAATADEDETWLNVPMHNLSQGTPDSSRATSNERSGHSSAANLTQSSCYLVPILPPEGFPRLDWRPFCLTTTILWVNATVCLILAGIIFAVLYGVGDDRQALLTSENAHILSTYSPTLIATINLLCFRATFFEYFRILPYYRMADQKDKITDGAVAAKSVGGSYFPWVFHSYSDDPWLKGTAQLMLICVSLLTTFKSVFLGSQETEGGWILTVHQKPAFYLVGAYSAMALFYIIIWLATRNYSTGLKWDPAAPCDHLALVWRTDAMYQIAGLPINYQKAYEVLPRDVRWRVGYWYRYDNHPDGRQTKSIVHGIGTREGRRGNPCNEEGTCTCQQQGGRCSFSRYLYPPMSGSFILSFLVVVLTAFVGMCIYIIVSGVFTNGAQLSGSWLKLNSTYVPNATNNDASSTNIDDGYIIVGGQFISAGDSTTANIIFRAVPTYIAGFVVPYFDGMEIRLRDITWISALASGPQPSSKSLALDYATQFSFVIPATACEQRHFRLAFVAFVNTFAPLCPVFVAGMVIFERRSAEVLHLVISKTSFIIVCGYLFFFIIATISSWPRKTELLLRPFYSIADLVKPFADSWLLEEDTVLDSAMTERNRERFRAKVLLAEYWYQLGVTKGTCGRSHRGIDIIGNELGEKYRRIISAKDLIMKMKTHKRGSRDGYSAIQAGLMDIQNGVAGSGTTRGS